MEQNSRNSKWSFNNGNSFWNNGHVGSYVMIPSAKIPKSSKYVDKARTVLKNSSSKIVKQNTRTKSKSRNS